MSAIKYLRYINTRSYIACRGTRTLYVVHYRGTVTLYVVHCRGTRTLYVVHCRGTRTLYVVYYRGTGTLYVVHCVRVPRQAIYAVEQHYAVEIVIKQPLLHDSSKVCCTAYDIRRNCTFRIRILSWIVVRRELHVVYCTP